jgi:Colicin V production protein
MKRLIVNMCYNIAYLFPIRKGQVMALAFTIVIALVLVVLGLVGYIRDLRRGLLALIGTLAGASLVSFWAAPWGLALAGSFVGGDPQRMIFIASCALLLWSALVVGYGGGTLLTRVKDRPPFQQRLAGALLGVLNGVLIVAFLLRFAITSQPSLAEMIESSPLAKILFDSLPLLFLGLAVVVTLAVFVRGIMLFATRRAAPAAPAAAAPATSASAPTQRIGDRDVLDKVNSASRH